MKRSVFIRSFAILLIFCIFCSILSGCAPGSKSSSSEPPVYSPLRVLVPEAPGSDTLGSSPLTLDVSNITQGYFVAQSDSADLVTSLQITAPTGVLYSYFIDPGENAVIPFTEGNGDYTVVGYQQIQGDQYAALYSEILTVELENDFLPFLYPNQYVNFSPDSEASKLALSMVSEDTADVDALKQIYNYVVNNLTYDYDKAETVETGYQPDVDETLSSKTGICFDYAALTTAMLRSCDIPCKLQIGYTGDIKHAWIDVYIRSKGWVTGAVSFNGDSWSLMDPTFDSSADSDDTEAIQDYIGNADNYTVQFTR